MRHKIFVGSASEELTAARAIRENLEECGHDVDLWSEGVFSIGKTALESLLAALGRSDAAVFVFAPSDLIRIRGQDFEAVRDNVVFELGLFIGKLGRDRAFWVVPQGEQKLRIVSDLLGVLPAEYVVPADKNWRSALRLPCRQIDHSLDVSARERGAKTPALSVERMGPCLDHFDETLRYVASRIVSDAAAAPESVEELPGGAGFTIRSGHKAELNVRFGCIEECHCTEVGTVIALPANEFFDDECVKDTRSALGAFVNHHFANKLSAFKGLVARERRRLSATVVEREAGEYQVSYGVGTALWLDAPLGSPFRLILSAVTRKRVGEGIKAEPAYLLSAVRSICRIMNDKRLTELHLPLFGAGHGDMDGDVALFCLVLALAATPEIRHANIVVYRAAGKPPAVDPAVVRRILAFVGMQPRR